MSAEQIEIAQEEAWESGILDALTALPEKYRLVLILRYVEGYRVEDIAKMINRTPSAVKMRLQKRAQAAGGGIQRGDAVNGNQKTEKYSQND